MHEQQRNHHRKTKGDVPLEIPSAFYTLVFDTYITSPPHLRTWSICQLIVQQILEHLDPDHKGFAITIAECVPPLAGQKVRSLRKTMGRGTGILRQYMERNTQFLGAESRIGQVVITGRAVVVQSAEQQAQRFPGHTPPTVQSAATYPLISANQIAGCLGVFSTQPNYLTQERQDLIERYAELLTVTFDPDEFYALDEIDLKIIPPCEKQLPFFADFQQLVAQKMVQASQSQALLTRAQAEQEVWQEIEELLILLAYREAIEGAVK